MPQLRQDVLGYLGSGDAPERIRKVYTEGEWGMLDTPEAVRRALHNETWLWRKADLYYVSADMTQLAAGAARTLPGFRLDYSDLPSNCGVMVFGAPVSEWMPGDVPVVLCVAWRVGVADYDLSESAPVVWLSWWFDRLDEPSQHFTFKHETHWMLGTDRIADPNNATLAHATVLSTWLLLGQQIAAVETLRHGERSSRKKVRKRKVDPVRLVTLRRRMPSGLTRDGEREWHHRWVVRGHWRNQWYPSQGRHVPVWIMPYIKGPDDKPMLPVRSTVNVLSR